MRQTIFAEQPRVREALTVRLVNNEIVVYGATTATPAFTPSAARATGLRLIEAADRLDGVAAFSFAGRRGH